eukprot:jgi/Hompol1/6289/HPOL_002238-RA
MLAMLSALADVPALPMLLAGICLVLIVTIAITRRSNKNSDNAKQHSSPVACVLVLGDIGHSPRMQNHALALAAAGFAVELVGFVLSPPLPALVASPAIRIVALPAPVRISTASKLLFIIHGLARSLSQIFSLLFTLLFSIRRPSFLLIQNPPAIPTLLVAQVVSFLLGSRLIIDWHNFGFSLMPKFHYEMTFGKRAYLHLCVTNAMATELRENWRVMQVILLSTTLFARLDLTMPEITYTESRSLETPITRIASAGALPELRADRPAILFSSTSWTPDEDFSIFFDALVKYDAEARKRVASHSRPLAKLLVIITGKGPLKDEYKKHVADAALVHVQVRFAWLKPEDYAVMVASANLGVSLHVSSSGFDLPMKIIDMFGCGVPACSFYYPAICELVQDGQNGTHFCDAEQLTSQIIDLLGDFPLPNKRLATLAEGVDRYRTVGWESYWKQTVLPHLLQPE